MLNLSKMRHAAQCLLPSFVSLCSAPGPSCGSDSCPYLSKLELNPTPDPSPTLPVPQTGLHALQPKILIPCAALCLVIYLPISYASCKGSWNERVWGCAAPGSVICVYFWGFMLKARNSLSSANIKYVST